MGIAIAIVIICIGIGFIGYCYCVAAGKADDQAEWMYQQWLQQHQEEDL